MPAAPDDSHVTIWLYCESGHLMGTYTDTMADKYQLWCGECDDTMSGKYPFTIKTSISREQDQSKQGDTQDGTT